MIDKALDQVSSNLSITTKKAAEKASIVLSDENYATYHVSLVAANEQILVDEGRASNHMRTTMVVITDFIGVLAEEETKQTSNELVDQADNAVSVSANEAKDEEISLAMEAGV